MGKPTLPPLGNHFCALMSKNEDWLEKAIPRLESRYGAIRRRSKCFRFEHSSYYESDMGKGLLQTLLVFDTVSPPDSLVQKKLDANQDEDELKKEIESDVNRPVNVDPGFLELGKLLLLSTKDASHRIHLGSGVYGEVTLMYQFEAFHPFRWTYPSYRHSSVLSFLCDCRKDLKRDLRGLR